LGGVGLEGVEVLADLGLPSRQARVYLTLLKLGVARARVVARMAGVPRQTVYGLLVELQHQGLIKQNLSAPISYVAIPFSEAIKMLLEQKTHELILISQKADQLKEKLDQPSSFILTEAPKPCFGEVCEGERGKKYQVAIEETQYSIDVLISWLRFKQLCFHCEKQLIDALKRDVKINIITQMPPKHNFPKWITPTQQKYPIFKLKTTPTSPEVAAIIFDETKLALAFDANTRLTKGPDLWTSHPALLVSYQTYFNSVWTKT
jgi:sugar-specific transcriptional regulator TrmB